MNAEDECQRVIRKKDYYDILGVDKTSNDDEIRRAYKKLAVKLHPDKNNSENAEEAFKKVAHAFSVLSNQQKRQNYDMFGSEEGMGAGNSGFSGETVDPFDIFNMFMGGNFQNMRGRRGDSSSNSNSHSQSRTSFSFNNGGTKFKVYSSFPGSASGFADLNGMFTQGFGGDEDYDENDEYQNHNEQGGRRARNGGDDILSQLFSQMNGGPRMRNTSRSRRDDSEEERVYREARERGRKHAERIQACCNSIPIIMLLVCVFLPYILRLV